MLKKENRLKSNAAFDATYKQRVKLKETSIALYAGKLKVDKNCPTRVGFVVSKKVHKRAVKRNAIKRKMRENVRLIIKNSLYPVINEYRSLIFCANSEILKDDFSKINKNITKLLDKLANKNL